MARKKGIVSGNLCNLKPVVHSLDVSINCNLVLFAPKTAIECKKRTDCVESDQPVRSVGKCQHFFAC